ncbi:hypothetical protein CHLNCDRAFT_50911 [Chlorella variabilis]|uniref:Exocyst subunit Exo70 family protein n=1 Tax=Chlorella variabilis TaxID=554065 RepID=E1Z8T0_CHLVA|nr:hypothetical protein CHLNCDRAFT_50911 [Chlorella variabilis]EFN57392.1 hypothetical protein CHLNCDRAFT_50911 [Chlorella variabilis]|eukprot:XP_005849494.1 hypothetical protein CHLNCDRAFT_50911 [Chlorella variabilis]
MGTSVAEAAVALRADLALLDASTKEAASLLDLASWQLGELGRQAAPMTSKTLALARAKENIFAAKQRSEEARYSTSQPQKPFDLWAAVLPEVQVLEHLDASRKMQGVIQAGPRAHLEGFLAALDRLEAAIAFLQAHRSMAAADDALAHTVALRDGALAACSREFSALLQKHQSVPPALLARLRAGAAAEGGGGRRAAQAAQAATPDPSPAPGAALGLLPEPVLGKLKALAGAMLRGSSRAAIKAYADSRRGVLQGGMEGFLAPFGGSREELSRLSWQQMEGRIPGWVAALRLYVRLAQEEARLCAAVFPPSEQAAVLSQVAAGGAASLLEAADVVLAARRVPEKLFGVLDMHDAAEGCLPPLRAALAAGASRLDRASAAAGAEPPPVVGQLGQLRARLGAEVRACFAELQESVARDAARGVPADGTVHPLCASAVSLLRRILAYQSALPVLFGDAAGPAPHAGAAGLAVEARLLERMGAAAAHLFDTLLAALEAKARLTFKSRALAALFQMNNLAHVVHACETSRELKAVGEGWAEQHKPKIEECQQQYVELAWGGLLSLLRQDARQGVPGGLAGDKAARQAVKDKWSAVNKMLAEAQGQQSWAVPDAALRFALKDALSDRLLPLYEAFWSKYRQAPYTDNHSKYERHSPADVASLVNELFERAEAGAPGMLGRSPSRSPASAGGTGGGGTLTRKLSGTMRRMTSSSQGTP